MQCDGLCRQAAKFAPQCGATAEQQKELAANVAAISAKVRTKKAAFVDSGFLSGAIWKGAILPDL